MHLVGLKNGHICKNFTQYGEQLSCLDTREPICFKLGMMLGTTNLYSMISVWMTLMFTQGHRVTENLICAAILL